MLPPATGKRDAGLYGPRELCKAKRHSIRPRSSLVGTLLTPRERTGRAEGRKVFDLIPFRPSALPVNSLCGALRAGLGPLSLSPSLRTPLPECCTIRVGSRGWSGRARDRAGTRRMRSLRSQRSSGGSPSASPAASTSSIPRTSAGAALRTAAARACGPQMARTRRTHGGRGGPPAGPTQRWATTADWRTRGRRTMRLRTSERRATTRAPTSASMPGRTSATGPARLRPTARCTRACGSARAQGPTASTSSGPAIRTRSSRTTAP